MKLSIIMPVYNERHTIKESVEQVIEVPLNMDKELIVVDDGSTDGTREILSQIAQNHNNVLQLILQDSNRGKGAAVRTGIVKATGDFIVIQDADMEYDPKDYSILLGPILAGKADVVYGSRFIGIHRCLMFWHYLGNKIISGLVNVLFNNMLSDVETCYKMFKADIIKGMRLESNDFRIEVEITAKILKRRCRIYEVPISYYGRTYEEGKKIRWTDGIKAVTAILKYRFFD